jgi:signal transduction histidine kinase
VSAPSFSIPRWNVDLAAHYERVESSGVTMLREARIGGFQTVVGVAFLAAVLPLVPPTEAIGDAGWWVAGAIVAIALAAGVWMLTTARMTPSQHLALIYLGLALVTTLTWLAGGVGTPYALFLALTVQHVAAHPLRRAAPFLLLASASVASCLVYSGSNPTTEAFVIGLIPTLLALAATTVYAINDLYGDAVAREIDEKMARTDADVARRTAESARAAATRLRELDQMKEGFVSTVSHELRSPLTSVKGYLEAMLDGEVGELNPDQREYAEIVYRNSTRLQALVDDLLILSRIEAGKLQLELERFDLAASVRALCERANSRAASGAPEVVLEGVEELEVVADRRRIDQAIGNLLSNAVKFTDGGEPVVVSIRGDGVVQVEVRDEGIGIPPAERERIGERFFRASNAELTPGSGLGLAIARELIERHGGSLAIKTRKGDGTTVTASWPQEVRR